MSDYRNVFGPGPWTLLRRFSKGIQVLYSMMMGNDHASSKMPIRLQIEVTDRCNHDCIMCNRTSRTNHIGTLNNDISYPLFANVIESINPFYVTLNGFGEPLLNKEINKSLALCNQRGITTAMPCNLSVANILNTKILTTPPTIITFSIHGATKEVFEGISRNSSFEKCMETLRYFLRHVNKRKSRVRILCAVQAKNLLEYKDMYLMLSDLDLLETTSLVPVYDYGYRGSDESRRIIPTSDEKAAAINAISIDIENCTTDSERRFYLDWKMAVEAITANETSDCDKRSEPCLIPWYSTYITAQGKVFPCCYLAEENSVMGDINVNSFEEIWNGNTYKTFRKQLRENRQNLNGCNYCPRNDTVRIRKYGFGFGKITKWKV